MKLVRDRIESIEVFRVPTRLHGPHTYVQTTVKIYWFHILFIRTARENCCDVQNP